MTQQEIQERNKQIALMLGYVNTTPTDKDFNIFEYPTKIEGIPKMIETMSMRFHSDWNWLMEAVEFIGGTLGYRKYSYSHEEHSRCVFTDMAILSQKHDFGGGNIVIDSGKQNTEKEAVFTAVSDFAQKFNNKEL